MKILKKLNTIFILAITFTLFANEISPARVEAATGGTLRGYEWVQYIISDAQAQVPAVAPTASQPQYDFPPVPQTFAGYTEYTGDYITTMVAFLVQIALAVVSLSLWLNWSGEFKTCFSFGIFLLATLGFLVEEIVSAIVYKNVSVNQQNLLINSANVNDTITTLKEMKKNVEEYKNMVEIKKWWIFIVACMDLAAAAVSLLEIAWCFYKNKGVCTAFFKDAFSKKGCSHVDEASNISTSDSIIYLAINTLLKFFIKPVSATTDATPSDSSLKNSSKYNDNQGINIASIVTGGIGLIVGSGVGLIIWGLVKYTNWIWWKCTLFVGLASRTILYLAAAPLAFTAFGIAFAKTVELEKRIATIDGMINTLEKLKTGETPQTTKAALKEFLGNEKISSVNKEAVSEKATVNNSPCFNLSQVPISKDSNCECKAKNNCNIKTTQNLKSLGNFTGSGDAVDAFKSINNATNAVANGNLQGSKAHLAAAANAAMKLNKNFDKNQKLVNDMLAKAKKKPIDFKAEADKLRNKILADTKKAIKNAGLTDAQLKSAAAELGIPVDGEIDKSKDGSGSKSGSSSALSDGSAGGSGTGSDGKKADESKAPDLNIFEDLAKGEDPNGGLQSKEDNKVVDLDQFEEKYNDINGNAKESIFKIISTRYTKSAFPVLLEMEKSAEKKDEKKDENKDGSK
ncbi:MAG: hypothetical protein HQK49_06215 [Oligoflexia bacterium]|nr:hypothetical protein [Oligoflexia bacterium]